MSCLKSCYTGSIVTGGEHTMDEASIRPGEIVGCAPERADATLIFIGCVRTPYCSPRDCSRHGYTDAPICRIEIDDPWRQAMQGLEVHTELQVLYWMDKARRDLLVQRPRTGNGPTGRSRLPYRHVPLVRWLCIARSAKLGIRSADAALLPRPVPQKGMRLASISCVQEG